jgi:hypothetical protein
MGTSISDIAVAPYQVADDSDIAQSVNRGNTGVNAQTGTSYTLALSDQGGVVTLTNASAIALDIPDNSAVAFPVGTQITVIQGGAGDVTVGAAGSATVATTAQGLIGQGAGSIGVLTQVAADSWYLAGADGSFGAS